MELIEGARIYEESSLKKNGSELPPAEPVASEKIAPL
jgi:hypothetical protein